jgi:hypothetical protein
MRLNDKRLSDMRLNDKRLSDMRLNDKRLSDMRLNRQQPLRSSPVYRGIRDLGPSW